MYYIRIADVSSYIFYIFIKIINFITINEITIKKKIFFFLTYRYTIDFLINSLNVFITYSR